MTIRQLNKLNSRSSFRLSSILITFALACFELSPTVRAVVPPPDGGYPGNNTAEGDGALFSLTTGGNNTALGFQVLFNNTNGMNNTATGSRALQANTTGTNNTATGSQALQNNTMGGDNNTATGALALLSNTTGFENTATGYQALQSNTMGFHNTANGVIALFFNTTGSDNTAIGWRALFGNTTGTENTAIGVDAGNNTTGNDNTAIGLRALFSNTTGSGNTATGAGALAGNTTGENNTANGFVALVSNTTGNENTASGLRALFSNTTGGNNTASGFNALSSNTTGSGNIGLGVGAGDNLTTGNNNIDIGNEGVAGEANIIRIGTQGTQRKTFVAGITGAGVTGSAVKINAAGQLGTAPSSQRFKDAIKPMDKASEAILALKPVTFHYKKEIDPEGTPEFGLVAEDVEKVNPDLVGRDAEGRVYTVRYEAVNAMLLNEFLKEHRKVQEQEAKIAQLKSMLAKQETIDAHQQEQIEALTAGLQRVSAQVEMSRTAPQVVDNRQ
jgi:trimeric autotransporter adhesin